MEEDDEKLTGAAGTTNPTTDVPQERETAAVGDGGGWGGWGFSAFSVLSDIQKVATTAAEEISRNAVAAAKNAAKGIADITDIHDSSPHAGEAAAQDNEQGTRAEDDEEENSETAKLRKLALDKLENASDDSLLGQGLKVLDSSVESIASGAWNALGTAWRGGSNLVQKLEHSAVNLADSLQHEGLQSTATSLAPSIIETGKSFTTKGIEVLERVGKETMEILITETGIEVEKTLKLNKEVDEEPFEEVTFDRCFYIYGGPDQLEELEALSNHHALLFNRRKAKLSSEDKSLYDGKLKEIQQIFCLGTGTQEIDADHQKGKDIEKLDDGIGIEMKNLRDSSVMKAAELASGFTAALGGLAPNDMPQRASDRLETIYSEGVHRLSELCCFAVSQLVMLGKSVISNSSKSEVEEADDDNLKIEWPEDPVSKANIIRSKAESMYGDVEAVSNSFITGVSDTLEAYVAALRSCAAEKHDSFSQQKPVEEKAQTISSHLQTDQKTAEEKIQDALQYLAYVVVSSSMPAV